MIFFKPKDIVSGDFYWTAVVGNMTFTAVVDCTGHGVPGAFMSMIGSTLLNEIVNQKNIYQPAEILDRLNKSIVKALKQDEKENRDGMDVCFIRTEKSEERENYYELIFCGAKRPLYVVNNEGFTELKGDRKSIGGAQNDEITFTDQKLELPQGTLLYLTTDGFADQNNEKRDKIGSKSLKELIKNNFKDSFEVQHQKLEKMLAEHMQNEKQRDDITILAVKL
jgi:serine phosphatase RsbU (regulator of sigma subunit)